MILTVTPNPALDYTVRVDSFELGRRSKYRDPRIDPAGKGINVARMVRRLGEPTLAIGFAAGATGDLLRQGLDREGVPHEFVSVDGLTRINVTLLTGPEGSATHVHGPGQPVTDADVGGFWIASRRASAAPTCWSFRAASRRAFRLRSSPISSAARAEVECGRSSTPKASCWPPPSTRTRTS